MEPVRNNVFDYVNEFYTQDPEWNRILPRSTVELFLRKESWAGKDNWRLMQLWEHILEFVLYCGHAETMPGDDGGRLHSVCGLVCPEYRRV